MKGILKGTLGADQLEGDGTFPDKQPFTWSAKRIREQASKPQTHDFVPKEFHRQFNGNIPPALRINPGDTVRTMSVDAGGVDEKGAHRSPGGNPLTGPFYIEGALPGDTLVVKLNRLRLNRDSANIYNDSEWPERWSLTICAIKSAKRISSRVGRWIVRREPHSLRSRRND